MKSIKVRITFTEECLATSPGNPEIAREFIASKAPDAKTQEEEIEALGVEAVVEKTKTIFPKADGKPFFWDYQIKGMFKDDCGMLRRIEKSESGKVKAYQKVIDGLIFVYPRKVFFKLPEGAAIGFCERPLRAQTPRGDRVCLANSETVPVGTSAEFEIKLLKDDLEKAVLEWLDYGIERGFSQWRNSGKGRFTYELLS